MSINNLNNDIVLIIINFLDDKAILQLGLCTKKYYLLSRNPNIWGQKLLSDFGINLISDMKLTYTSNELIETYKWYKDFPLRFKCLWYHLEEAGFVGIEKFEKLLRWIRKNDWL